MTLEELQLVRAALNGAYMKSQAEDLIQGYVDLNPNPLQSRLNQALIGALTIVEGELSAHDDNEHDNNRDEPDDGSDGSPDRDNGGGDASEPAP